MNIVDEIIDGAFISEEVASISERTEEYYCRPQILTSNQTKQSSIMSIFMPTFRVDFHKKETKEQTNKLNTFIKQLLPSRNTY